MSPVWWINKRGCCVSLRGVEGLYVWLVACSKIGVGAKIRVFWSHGGIVKCPLSAARYLLGSVREMVSAGRRLEGV